MLSLCLFFSSIKKETIRQILVKYLFPASKTFIYFGESCIPLWRLAPVANNSSGKDECSINTPRVRLWLGIKAPFVLKISNLMCTQFKGEKLIIFFSLKTVCITFLYAYFKVLFCPLLLGHSSNGWING